MKQILYLFHFIKKVNTSYKINALKIKELFHELIDNEIKRFKLIAQTIPLTILLKFHCQALSRHIFQ